MTQLSVIQKNSMLAMKTGSNTKSAELTESLKQHLKNRPTEDNSRSRDTDIANMQNEAAVAEKNIRKLTMQIEEQQRERASRKDDRQQKYEAMNSANNVLQGKKQEKDAVFQRLRSHRAGQNALRVGGGRDSIRSVKDLDDAIRATERTMQTEVLSLREEKALIRKLKDYRNMRPEVEATEKKCRQLNEYKESTAEQQQSDELEYKRLKAAVQKDYEFQQSQYELFRAAVEIDQEISDRITEAMEKRREMYDTQKSTRDKVTARRRDFQKSMRDVQQWDMKKRRLEQDVQRAKRAEAQSERTSRMQEERDQRRANDQAHKEYEASLEAQPAEEQPEEEAALSPKKARATPRPRPQRQRQVYVAEPRDVHEQQKEQLTTVETYIRTLVPQTGASAVANAAESAPSHARKGVFKPSRENEGPENDDLFAKGKKGKKSKRRRAKKVKQTLLVQSQMPPTVTDAMSCLSRWAAAKGCPVKLALPMRASEAAECLHALQDAREWLDQYESKAAAEAEQKDNAPAEEEAAEDEPAVETAEADEEEAAAPAEDDTQEPTEDGDDTIIADAPEIDGIRAETEDDTEEPEAVETVDLAIVSPVVTDAEEEAVQEATSDEQEELEEATPEEEEEHDDAPLQVPNSAPIRTLSCEDLLAEALSPEANRPHSAPIGGDNRGSF